MKRFYDVGSGSVQIDGVDIKDYNVKWLRLGFKLFWTIGFFIGRSDSDPVKESEKNTGTKPVKTKNRSQIGIVSQEPILFDSTIRENIQMGNLDVTQEEIDRALVQANAAEFVSKVRYDLFFAI